MVGSKRLSADLGGIVEQVNDRGHGLHLDYSLDDPGRSRRRSTSAAITTSTRSTAFPVAFFFTGVHGDYHGLDDEIDRIDFGKMQRIAQLVYGTARTIADRPARPKVDGGRGARDRDAERNGQAPVRVGRTESGRALAASGITAS